MIDAAQDHSKGCATDIGNDVGGIAKALIMKLLDHFDAARQDQCKQQRNSHRHRSAEILPEREKSKYSHRHEAQQVHRHIAEKESVNACRPRMNKQPEWTSGELCGVEVPRIQGPVHDEDNHDQENAVQAGPDSLHIGTNCDCSMALTS